MKELEVKVLDIDIQSIKKRLDALGAYYKWEGLQRVWVFDVPTLYSRVCELLQLINDENFNDSIVVIEKALSIALEIKNCFPQLSGKADEFLSMIKVIERVDEQTNLVSNFFSDIAIIEPIKRFCVNDRKWVRVRSDNRHSTITIKEICGSDCGLQDVNEYEVEVTDVDSTIAILKELGIVYRNYQEKQRISYTYKNSKIDIDSWPYIKPYLEIEAESSDLINEILKDLNINSREYTVVSCNTSEIYSRSGLDIYKFRELRFPK